MMLTSTINIIANENIQNNDIVVADNINLEADYVLNNVATLQALDSIYKNKKI